MKCPIPNRSPAQVGYVRLAKTARSIYFPPEKVKVDGEVGKSEIPRCPAVQNIARNMWAIMAPFDLELEFEGETLRHRPNKDPAFSQNNFKTINSQIVFVDPKLGRFPDKPVFQLDCKYAFASDTPGVQIQQLPPFAHFGNWPGVIICGAYDIYNWPYRPLIFAFEWHDKTRPLLIKRGDPLFYLQFIAPNGANIELVEVADDDRVASLRAETGEVAKFVKNTRSLMELFGRRRPKRVVFPIEP